MGTLPSFAPSGCGAITQWFGVRGFVSCGAVALACVVLVNFAAASPRKN